MMKYQTVKVTEVFTPKRGDAKYTKAYGQKVKGEYPVYSAANEPLTHINHFDYDGKYLTWSTNGFGGYVKVLEGKFSVNGDRGVLIPLREDIDLDYAELVLQPSLRKLAKGRLGDRGKNEFTKVSLDTVERKATIGVPLLADGSLDIDAQKKMAKDLRDIKNLKTYIINQIDELRSAQLTIPLAQKRTLTLKVQDIFDLNQPTNKSDFTKRFVHDHPGNVPVYSASQDEGLVGYGYVADNLPGIKYFNDTLTWNIDGSVGKAFFREGRFSLSEKVIPLIVKPELTSTISLAYVKFILEEKAAEQGFGYSKKAGKSRISNIEIALPSKDGKTPDIDLQREMADRYKAAYELKEDLLNQLYELVKHEVSLIG